jgi:AcrR family transcriptional regulator
MSGTAGKRTRLSSGERRERILAAASREFAAHGYAGASLRALAAAGEVTTPVIYDHFASKAELYAAVAQTHADALLARWAEPSPGSPRDIFRETMESIFGWVEEHPDGWRILFADPPADPLVAASLEAIQDRATGALAALFAALPALDRPAALSRARADRAYAEAAKNTVIGLAAWWWHNRDVPRETVVALAGDLLWRGLADITRAEPTREEPT